MAACCVYWLAEHNFDEITKALELFRKHDGWKDDNATIYLAFGCQDAEFQSSYDFFKQGRLQRPVEFLINLYREYGTKKPLCDSIFDLKEQLVALQLVMAQQNKEETGEFTVKMQDVLEAHKAIMKSKLSLDEDDDSTVTAKICSAYNKFLSHCNAVDFADVLQRVKTCFIVDSNIRDMFQTSQQFVVLGKPMTELERQILLLIVGNRTMMCFEETKDCQHSLSEKTVNLFLREASEANSGQSTDSPKQRSSQPTVPVKSQHEVAKDQLFKVMLSYLRLLVNSRDELALSQAINIPYRGLAHKHFTVLRKVAREKNMPMFQTAVSFILRIRLGGKSYAPTDDNPLLPLTKGLGEFVTFFQKLQNICEEATDTKAAVLRIINALKVSITKAKEKVFTNECIGEVVESLQRKVEELSSKTCDSDKITSTMVGMKVYLLIQAMLDQQVKQTCSQEYQASDVRCSLMTPETTHGKSKVRSMLSQFRTPDSESLEEAITPEKENPPPKTKPEKKPIDSYRKVCGDMNWAKPAISIKLGPSPATKRDHMMTAATNTDIVSSHKDITTEQSVDSTPKCRNKKRTLKESMFDQENIFSSENTDKQVSKPPAKRILLERDTTGGIKNSKGKATGKAKPNRKQIKLLQGQRQLTNFFNR